MPESGVEQVKKISVADRYRVQIEILRLLLHVGGRFEGTMTTFSGRLKNDHNSQPPFTNEIVVMRQLRILERDYAIACTRGPSADPVHRGLNGHVVTEIALRTEGEQLLPLLEAKLAALPPAPPIAPAAPAADGQSPATNTGESDDVTVAKKPPRNLASQEEIRARCDQIVTALLGWVGPAPMKQELMQRLSENDPVRFSYWKTYHYLEKLESEGVIAFQPRAGVRGLQVILKQMPATAPGVVASAAQTPHAATAPAVTGRLRIKSQEELQDELAIVDAEINEQLARRTKILDQLRQRETLVQQFPDLVVPE